MQCLLTVTSKGHSERLNMLYASQSLWPNGAFPQFNGFIRVTMAHQHKVKIVSDLPAPCRHVAAEPDSHCQSNFFFHICT